VIRVKFYHFFRPLLFELSLSLLPQKEVTLPGIFFVLPPGEVLFLEGVYLLNFP